MGQSRRGGWVEVAWWMAVMSAGAPALASAPESTPWRGGPGRMEPWRLRSRLDGGGERWWPAPQALDPEGSAALELDPELGVLSWLDVGLLSGTSLTGQEGNPQQATLHGRLHLPDRVAGVLDPGVLVGVSGAALSPGLGVRVEPTLEWSWGAGAVEAGPALSLTVLPDQPCGAVMQWVTRAGVQLGPVGGVGLEHAVDLWDLTQAGTAGPPVHAVTAAVDLLLPLGLSLRLATGRSGSALQHGFVTAVVLGGGDA